MDESCAATAGRGDSGSPVLFFCQGLLPLLFFASRIPFRCFTSPTKPLPTLISLPRSSSSRRTVLRSLPFCCTVNTTFVLSFYETVFSLGLFFTIYFFLLLQLFLHQNFTIFQQRSHLFCGRFTAALAHCCSMPYFSLQQLRRLFVRFAFVARSLARCFVRWLAGWLGNVGYRIDE